MITPEEDALQRSYDYQEELKEELVEYKQKVKDVLERVEQSADMKYANGEYMYSIESRRVILSIITMIRMDLIERGV